MPTPRPKTENKKHWMDRCIPRVIKDGTAEDSGQAFKVCESMWEEAKSRAEPDQVDDSLETRVLSVRAETVNEDERSIEAVLASDSPVEVYSWRDGPIDEVLLVDGVKIPERMPLLAMHNRFSLDYVLGSVRQITSETQGDMTQLVGRLYFAEGDEDAERAWNKVRQGHLTDVSIGYRRGESSTVKVEPGQTAKVRGRTFTARDRSMHVVSQWKLREASIVPIGADQIAKTRDEISNTGAIDMDSNLREYLVSIGMREEATDAEAWQYVASLQGEQREETKRIMLGQSASGDGRHNDGQGVDEKRGDQAHGDGDDHGNRGDQNQQTDPEAVAQRAVTAERERVRQITDLAGEDVPPQMRQQAIDEGWDVNRASREFLSSVRQNRQPENHQVPYQATSHSRTSTPMTERTLAAGLLIGQGLDPVEQKCRIHDGKRLPLAKDQLTEQDCEQGDDFRRLSAVDLVRACAQMDHGRMYWDVEEAVRAAMSGGALSRVFSTNVYAKLMEGWTQLADTTVGWCDEEDVANFLSQEDISIESSSRLEQLGRGGTANHAEISDSYETYKLARYAKQFVVDEQDIIDDRLGAIMRMPMEMGQAARDLRPDLVYSMLLENPTLTATSGDVFNSTAVTTDGGHNNLGTSALSSDSLKEAITAMVRQRLSRTSGDPGKQLTIRPRFLIVPAELEWTARELTAAAALAKLFADSSDPYYAQLNLLAQEGLRVVVDDRIGSIGVMDPRSGNARTGTDANWFLTSGGSRGLRVAYRRGTGRQPQMRNFTLDRGQWGLGWDINMDIGAAFLDYRPWYKSTGAA